MRTLWDDPTHPPSHEVKHLNRRTLVVALALVPFALPSPPLSAQEPDELEARAIRWIEMIDRGQLDSAEAQVSPQVAAQLSAEVMGPAWLQVTAQTGDLQSLAPAEQTTVQGLRAVNLTGVFANGSFVVQVIYDADDLVMGFFVRPPGG